MSRIQASLLLSKFVELSQRLAADSWCSIVLIHGLQGHPYKTWARKISYKDMPLSASSSCQTPGVHDGSRKYHRVVPEFPEESSDPSKTGHSSNQEGYGKSKGGGGVKGNKVFWPKDLLPIQYPNARISVYGYDSNVSKFMSGPTNENFIHSHGKDLLFSLAASHKLDSRLVLIAHSLGGIIVKEMLAYSASYTEDRLRNIVTSTEAVIFLGTPHRGSHDFAQAGDVARRIINAFGMKTHEGILKTLNLKTKDLERAQDSFSSVWDQYKFSVKTFQEGLGLTGVSLGPFGRKVVPDESSLLGNYRERAETIQANHMEMCRFTGSDDPNYARICGEITSICNRLAVLEATTAHRVNKYPVTAETLIPTTYESKIDVMSEREKTCLRSLVFPNMNQRVQNLDNPTEGTCSWLFKHEAFVEWLTDKNQAKHCGLLWIKGKPGSGKSTLVKDAFFRATMEMSGSQCQVISFFFNAKGEELEHSSTGMMRSILHQMCSQNLNILGSLLDFARSIRALCGDDRAPWEEAELKAFVRSAIIEQKQRVIIFIDAIDECNSDSVRDVADFWRETTKTTYSAGAHLSVCLSSRHFPAITVNDCPEIIVEDHNYPDVVEFVGRRLDLGMSGTLEDRKAIQQKILERSGGVFLWVSLVVKDVLRKMDEGRGLNSLLKDLDSVPPELEDLFRRLLTTENISEVAIKLFQWALLPAKPLRLHEWHHVLAFVGETIPSSLHEWRQSDNYTETDEQLEKRVTHLSRGLLGFSTRIDHGQEPSDEPISDRAGAGSLDPDTGETRVVQCIHETVRQFFMDGPGFALLDPAFAEKPLAHAHLSIMRVCLDYILISELDALVEARVDASKLRGMEDSAYARANNRRFHKAAPDKSYTSRLSVSLPSALATFPTADITYDMSRSKPPPRPGSPASVSSFGSASSHEGRQTPRASEWEGHLRDTNTENQKSRKRPFWSEPRSPAPRRRRRKDNDVSMHEKLKELSGPTEAYDVASWRLRNVPVVDWLCYNEYAASKSPQASVTGCSEVLEDHPALLSFATFELFTHAQKANAEDLDPRPIIRLCRGSWPRWVALREDLDRRMDLLYFVADLSLSSWLKAEGVWNLDAVSRGIESAMRYNNTRALGNILAALPSRGYRNASHDGAIVRFLARGMDVALLQAYISQHPSQNPSSPNSSMVLKDILESRDEDGRTALHLATIQRNIAGVSVLLEHGADASAVDKMCWTPLHLACLKTLRSPHRPSSDSSTGSESLNPGNVIITLLLDHGAHIDAFDEQHRTPLMVACLNRALRAQQERLHYFERTEVQYYGEGFNTVEILLNHGANFRKRDSMGSLPLHEACWNSSDHQSKVYTVRKLLHSGSPVNEAGAKGATPLHIACCCSDVTIVEELLQQGADPVLRDQEGHTPLHLAAAWSTEEVVMALLSLPSTSVDATDTFGSTPLHLACNVSSNADQIKPTKLSIIRRLLAHGAKAYTIRNRFSNLPVDEARYCGFGKALDLMAEESCDAPPRE